MSDKMSKEDMVKEAVEEAKAKAAEAETAGTDQTETAEKAADTAENENAQSETDSEPEAEESSSEAGDAGEKLDNHLLRIVHHADFPVGQVLFGKSVGVRRHVLGLDGGECLQDPEYGVVLGKSIDKIQAAIPPAHVDYPVYDVKISIHIQLFVEVSDIVR